MIEDSESILSQYSIDELDKEMGYFLGLIEEGSKDELLDSFHAIHDRMEQIMWTKFPETREPI